MAVLYYETEHYNIRYYRDGSDTSSDVVEKHAAEVIDDALHGIQAGLTDHQGVTDGSAHGINELISDAVEAVTEVIGAIIYSVSIPIPEIAAGVSNEVPVWAAPADCILQKISIIPKTSITGADTDYFTLSVIDKGSTGVGADSIVSLAFDNGENAVAFAAKNLGALDGTHKVLAQGDTISFKKAESGIGMIMPDLVCVIEYKLNY